MIRSLMRHGFGLSTLAGGAGVLVVAGLIMVGTNPSAIGPLGVTLWFLLVLIGLIGIGSSTAYFLQHQFQDLKQRDLVITALRRGTMVAGFVIVVLGLASLRQLNLRDPLLLLLLIALVEFYVVARA